MGFEGVVVKWEDWGVKVLRIASSNSWSFGGEASKGFRGEKSVG